MFVTQISHIETEANGLQTYGPAVGKMDRRRIRAAIAGDLPLLTYQVLLRTTTSDSSTSWRYTLARKLG